jgi:chromatin remodeling complex protein RSC6
MSKEKKPSAFMKPVQLSKELEAIIGRGPMARTDVTKKVWDYIKKHKLQDAKNKRMINPDKALAEILGKNPIDMFKMTSLLAKHIKEPAYAGSH